MGVFLQHEVTGAVIETTEINGDGGEAQARNLAPLGWHRAAPVLLAASTYTDRTVSSLDDLSKDELAGFAEQTHIDVGDAKTKADLVAAINDAFGATQIEELSTALADARTEAALSEPQPQAPADAVNEES